MLLAGLGARVIKIENPSRGGDPARVPDSYFVTRSLEQAGIPVLQVRADNADSRSHEPEQVSSAIKRFIEQRISVRRRNS